MSFWIGRINRESAYSAAEKPAPNQDLHDENGYLQFSAFRINPSLIKCDFPWSRCKICATMGLYELRWRFFTKQTFSIIIPLVVPWGPNLDHCGKIVILTGARKNHIKVVCVFLPIRHFQFSFLWLSLDVPTWILAARMWSRQVRAKFTSKSFMFFAHQTFSIFIPLAALLVSQLGPLLQKCYAGKCNQNSHKSRFCFFALQTFSIFIPLAVPWVSNLDPCGKSAILAGARKIHSKVVYVFLPMRHFPFSFPWLSLGVPTCALAAKVWSWQVYAKFA